MGGIDEAALDRLSLVTEMTKHIRVRASGGDDGDELAAFTPAFLWCARTHRGGGGGGGRAGAAAWAHMGSSGTAGHSRHTPRGDQRQRQRRTPPALHLNPLLSSPSLPPHHRLHRDCYLSGWRRTTVTSPHPLPPRPQAPPRLLPQARGGRAPRHPALLPGGRAGASGGLWARGGGQKPGGVVGWRGWAAGAGSWCVRVGWWRWMGRWMGSPLPPSSPPHSAPSRPTLPPRPPSPDPRVHQVAVPRP